MSTNKRAVRIPADNCPECLGSETYATMATLTHDDTGTFFSGIEVAYRCRNVQCANSWITAWAMEYVE
jgi:hypothetical protein